jgi:hypothetical protein
VKTTTTTTTPAPRALRLNPYGLAIGCHAWPVFTVTRDGLVKSPERFSLRLADDQPRAVYLDLSRDEAQRVVRELRRMLAEREPAFDKD